MICLEPCIKPMEVHLTTIVQNPIQTVSTKFQQSPSSRDSILLQSTMPWLDIQARPHAPDLANPVLQASLCLSSKVAESSCRSSTRLSMRAMGSILVISAKNAVVSGPLRAFSDHLMLEKPVNRCTIRLLIETVVHPLTAHIRTS